MDPSATSLVLTIVLNIGFMGLILVFFGVIRKCRGDKQKVRITNKLAQMHGVDTASDLEAILLEPKERMLINLYTSNPYSFLLNRYC